MRDFPLKNKQRHICALVTIRICLKQAETNPGHQLPAAVLPYAEATLWQPALKLTRRQQRYFISSTYFARRTLYS